MNDEEFVSLKLLKLKYRSEGGGGGPNNLAFLQNCSPPPPPPPQEIRFLLFNFWKFEKSEKSTPESCRMH